jgi:hypothetical protein
MMVLPVHVICYCAPDGEDREKQKRGKSEGNGAAATLPMPAMVGEHLDISMLETWLWNAACAIDCLVPRGQGGGILLCDRVLSVLGWQGVFRKPVFRFGYSTDGF